ncbi:MAG: hypothetical protein E6K11_04135 [Methanobacteriota archaeon]|nr:MAG: hypothetical protein E6K11_04135 [Euryarchaeota archaeon]
MQFLFSVPGCPSLPSQSPRASILKEALRSRHHEPFERSLGRAVRELGGNYSEYLAIIAQVREYGRTHKLDLRDAARALADQL